MKKYTPIYATLFFSMFAFSANANESKGTEIAQKVELANNGFKSDKASLELIIYDASGGKIERRFDAESIEVAGDGDRSVNTFTLPADVAGTRLLTWAHGSGDDDQWMYLPALKRVKRISSANKTGSFMGSEFAYEDVGGEEFEEFTYKYLDEVTENGRKAWKIERISKSPRSGYGKQIVWFDQEYMARTKIEYYDKKMELLKVATYEDYKQYENWWRPHLLTMKNVKTQKHSVVKWISYSLNTENKAESFSPDNLQY